MVPGMAVTLLSGDGKEKVEKGGNALSAAVTCFAQYWSSGGMLAVEGSAGTFGAKRLRSEGGGVRRTVLPLWPGR
jgi:hypothetical protein